MDPRTMGTDRDARPHSQPQTTTHRYAATTALQTCGRMEGLSTTRLLSCTHVSAAVQRQVGIDGRTHALPSPLIAGA